MSEINLTSEKAVFPLGEDKKEGRASTRKNIKPFLFVVAAGLAVAVFIVFWLLRGQSVLTPKPTSTIETKNQAIALFNKGDFKKAIPKLEVYVKEHPSDLAARSVLAQSYWLNGKYKQALGQYKEITKVKSNDADTLYRLGILYGLLKDDNRSITSLKKAAEVNPKLAVFQAELAKAYTRTGKYDQAVTHWQEALELTPEENKSYRANVFAEIGNIYTLKKDTAKAKNAYEEGLKIDGDNQYLKSQLDKLGK